MKRIFFGSGMVLVYPRSGEWLYPALYYEYCEERSLPAKSLRQQLNYRVALSALSSRETIEDEGEEYEAFLEFYSILFRGVAGKDDPALAKLCADSMVYDPSKYAFYGDVGESLARLNCKYELGIISDAWPSLKGVYRAGGVAKYFDPFIISSMYGCSLRGYDLFRFALANAAQRPEECLFVDGSYGNCARARKLGMQVLVLNRSGRHRQRGDTQEVSTMGELESALGLRWP